MLVINKVEVIIAPIYISSTLIFFHLIYEVEKNKLYMK